jgi:RND family efflux transporter MFP subunit
MNQNLNKILVTLMATACLLVAISYAQSGTGGTGMPGPPGAGMPPSPSTGKRDMPLGDQSTETKQQSALPTVTVVQAESANHQAKVVGYGETSPHFHLKLASEVSGQVLHLAPKLASGERFKKGELLLEVEQTSYRQALNSAEYELNVAETELLEASLNAKQAKSEWQRSGLQGEPESALVLHEPQLRTAQAKVTLGKQTLAKAKAELDKTRITAPFNALVVSRDVQPGSYVQSGTQLLELYSTDRVEVSIPLSEAQWQILPSPDELSNQNWPVQLSSSDGKNIWEGYIARSEQHLDTQNRQRALVVAVDTPLDLPTPLYPGTFVSAEIPGRVVSQTWQIPLSSITQDSTIWIVDSGKLKSLSVEILFSDKTSVYIHPIDGIDKPQVVVHPLSSYLPEMRVEQRLQDQQSG